MAIQYNAKNWESEDDLNPPTTGKLIIGPEGDYNLGLENKGSGNCGHSNIGNDNRGNRNHGNRNYGDKHIGSDNKNDTKY